MLGYTISSSCARFHRKASDLQRKISQFSKEINWLKEGTSKYEEFVLAEIERISKKKGCL